MSKPSEDKNIDVPTEVLADLLTPSEVRMLKNRWQIINLLEDGLSIRAIAQRVGVGTDTVVRVARMSEKSGIRNSNDGTNSKQNKGSTSYVFGKSDE